jgi:hypothetical protein
LPFFSLKGKIIGRYAVETEENIWVILKKVNAEKPYVKLPSSNFPKGILKITDIPQILDVVRKRINITSF